MTGKKQKCIYDPLTELISYYSSFKTEPGVTLSPKKAQSAEEILKEKIINGDKANINKDLDTALKKFTAVEIINNILLDAMKEVGNLFGSGQMQLPFVLQSAECMKTAVSYLEKFIEKNSKAVMKGTIILATVRGDVHDIGKNLADIILTNNGYRVINLGIKCPIEKMLFAYEKHKADAIGMSGLLVKSTTVMKDNLELIKERKLNIPVILGGAALTRKFVEDKLKPLYGGEVYYAGDAFDGIKYMELIIKNKTKKDISFAPTVQQKNDATESKPIITSGKPSYTSYEIPVAPFWGSKVTESIPLDKIFEYINQSALFKRSWKVRKDRSQPDSVYKKLLTDEIIPKFNELILLVKREKLFRPKVIYGYFPVQSDGNDLIIYKPKGYADNNLHTVWSDFVPDLKNIEEWQRFTFPRQTRDKHLCISQYFKSVKEGITDTAAFQIVTTGSNAAEYSDILFKENKYKDYLYFHGFSIETAEALAEYQHKIIRKELKIDSKDSPGLKEIFRQGYRGSRYSFGYPACPNLEDNKKLFEILLPERIGISLTEEFQMVPEQTTSAIIVHHPEARYFSV